MKKILFLLIIIVLSINAYTQDQHKIDSLQNELKKFEVKKKQLGAKVPLLYDSTAANILVELSIAYWSNNPDKAMDYANKCLALSEKIGYKKGIGRAYNSIGVINLNKGDYVPSLEFHKKALKIFVEIGYKKGIASCYNNIGIIYCNQCKYSEALVNYSASLKIRE